ncbi:MAG: ARMT1-like domain-containing protein, partial [Candidatus Omnitrophota bacterium]
IIDFGVKNRLNIKEELKRITAEKSRAKRRNRIFHYPAFKKSLKNAKSILYLADNAGEVVFDRILIEEIKKKYPGKIIFYAVKEKPIINDALLEDALFCGIDRVARIISNGTDAPGTILSLCSSDFKKIYKSADMVISKGQGNFESLSKAKKEIFFLFMVKCPVVAREVKGRIGDYVLLYNKA